MVDLFCMCKENEGRSAGRGVRDAAVAPVVDRARNARGGHGLRRALAALGMALALIVATVMPGGALVPAAYAEDAGAAADRVALTAGVIVAGVDDASAEEPAAEAWVPLTDVEFEEGATAWQLIQPLLDKAGITYDAQDSQYGIFVQSITKDGRMLENTASEPYSFWAFLVNGEMANEGVGAYVVQSGDQISLEYYPGGEPPIPVAVPISAELPEGDEASDPKEPAEMDLGTKVGAAAFVLGGLILIGVSVHLMNKRKGE